MKESNKRNYDWFLIAIILVWLFVHYFLFSSKEILIITDSKAYIYEADYLLNQGSFQHPFRLLYGSYIAFIALIRLVSHNATAIVFLQSFISLLAIITLYRRVTYYFENSYSGFISSLIFLLWWDCIVWDIAVLTESLFCSLNLLLITKLISYQGTKRDILQVIVLIVLILFSRPTGVVILVGSLIYFVNYYRADLRLLGFKKKMIYVSLLFSICVLGATLLFQKWDFTDNYKIGNIITYMHTVQGTPLYSSSLHMPLSKEGLNELEDHSFGILNMADFVMKHPLYVLKTGALKIFYLMTFYRPYYSFIHNMFNAVWLVIIYVAFTVGILKSKKHPVKLFVLTVIVVNCLLIAISAADWDNRFYIPMEPGIVLFAGYGIWIIGSKYILKPIQIFTKTNLS